jgi:hypothetical protein
MLIEHLTGNKSQVNEKTQKDRKGRFGSVITEINQKIEAVIIKKYPDLNINQPNSSPANQTEQSSENDESGATAMSGQSKEAPSDAQKNTVSDAVDRSMYSIFTKDALSKYALKHIADCNIKEVMFYDPEECVNAIYITHNYFYQFAMAQKQTIQSIDALITYLRQEKVISREDYKITLPDGTENEIYCLSLNDIPDVINDCPGEIWQEEDVSISELDDTDEIKQAI